MDNKSKRFHIYSTLSKHWTESLNSSVALPPNFHSLTPEQHLRRPPFVRSDAKYENHVSTLTHANTTAAFQPQAIHSFTYPPATRIICMSQSVDATSPPPGPTSRRHHTFTPHHSRRRFLSPCGGTHRGGGARGHVGTR
jgi:hypothetical protein